MRLQTDTRGKAYVSECCNTKVGDETPDRHPGNTCCVRMLRQDYRQKSGEQLRWQYAVKTEVGNEIAGEPLGNKR